MEAADGADVVCVPLVFLGHLKCRGIRLLTSGTGIGNIAAGYAGTAVALRGKMGIAVRAGVVSVLPLRRELVLLDAAACEDDLFAVCGREQTTESIVAFRFQCRTADCASDRSSGHIVLAGAIHRVLAQLAVGARFGVGVQLFAIDIDCLDREGFLRRFHREVHTAVAAFVIVRNGSRILLTAMQFIVLSAQIAADKVHNAVSAGSRRRAWDRCGRRHGHHRRRRS